MVVKRRKTKNTYIQKYTTNRNGIWKKYLHCSITTMLELFNNFIRTRLTVKSRDCNTLLGKAHTSNPYFIF